MKECSPNHLNVGVALGKYWKLNPNTQRSAASNLSFDAKLTAQAARWLLDNGNIDRLIFSAGKTASFTDVSEAVAMRDYARLDADDNRVTIEEETRDTHGSALAVAELLRNLEADVIQQIRLHLITVDYHGPRAAKEYRDAGIEPDELISSNAVIRELPNHQFQPCLERYDRSNAKKGWIAREGLSWVIHYVPYSVRKGPMKLWRGGLRKVLQPALEN